MKVDRTRANAASACVATAVAVLFGLAPHPGAKAQTAVPPAAPAAEPATPAAAAPESAWTVEVEAPEPLKALLERYLDLARLQRSNAEQGIAAFELNRLIEASPRQVRDLLQTEGYFEPRVTIERIPRAADGASQVLRVRVEPGPLTRVQRLKIDMQGELATALAAREPDAAALVARLNKAWPLQQGAAFRNALWAEGKSTLLAQLRSAGYVAASLSTSAAEIDPQNQSAALNVVADTGPLFRTGAIEIEGLALHDRSAVLNNARFAEGAAASEALLLDFQERLLKSGLFEQASVTLEADVSQAAAAPLRIRVKELAAHQLVTGLGYSSNVGPRVTLEYLGRRVLGWPATLRNKAEWSQRRQALNGELSTHVRPDNYRWFGGLTIERLVTDTDSVLAQRLRLGRALEFARIDRSQFFEWDGNTRRTSQGRDVIEAATINQTLLWRDIDSPLLPTNGETLGVQLGVGQISNTGNGSGPVARVWARGTIYRPLGGGWFGQARLEAGQVFAKESAAVTDGLGFRAGGDGSVRGYGYRSLGPVRDGAVASGKSVMTASAEIARPLSANLPTLWGAVFVDAGDAADSWRDLQPVTGAGIGLRWRSPVGPLQMDLAYGQATNRVRLHFSVGIVF